MGITEPKAFGPTKSIYGRTSGGSSGGSGACVVAKIVPMAAGGDGGGSLRIPAACNGVFALKPSRGLNPTGPQHGECWDGATSLHILSRSVRDSAHMLDITARKELGSPYPISFGGPYLNQLQQKLAPQKISFSTQHPLGFPVDQACKDAVLKTVNILEDLGHHVEEKQLPINFDLLAKTYLTTMMGHMAYELRTLKKNNLPLDIELTSHLLGILGESITAGEFVEMKTHWHRFALAMEEYHLEFPMHICPVIATPPPVIGQFEPSGLEKKMMEVMALFKLGKLLIKTGLVDKLAKENLAVFGFTQLSNLTGHPSISLPHYYSQGLPIGVQVMSSLGKDLPLLQLAQVIEAYTRWND
jgi:amidase